MTPTRCPLCDAATEALLATTSAGNVYRCDDCHKSFLIPDRDPLANAPTMKKRGAVDPTSSRR